MDAHYKCPTPQSSGCLFQAMMLFVIFELIGAEKGTMNERFPMAVSKFILQLTAFVMHGLTLSHFTVGVLG